MKTCCTLHPYKSRLCRPCWLEHRQSQYHCTWPNCLRPVLTLTLCRTHYRRINVNCAWPQCTRPSYCRQVCAHHYRKREFPDTITCSQCSKPVYMDRVCFYHYTFRTCTQCDRKVFSKQLCQRHYMKRYRSQRLLLREDQDDKGSTTSNENKADTDNIIPDTVNQSPDNHSSLEHSAISD